MLGEGYKYDEYGHSLEGNKDREDVRQREKSRDLEHQKTCINVCAYHMTNSLLVSPMIHVKPMMVTKETEDFSQYLYVQS